ncbi:hypothetical protein RZS08_43030, partial [Arthrospira platensis SPKY1]|nr:hypothetical protein [Arthrospira platensis SPKY1]
MFECLLCLSLRPISLMTFNCLSFFIFATGSGGGVFTYFAQSNLAGKVIIFVLAICSVIAWLIMLSKWMELKDMLLRNRRFETRI